MPATNARNVSLTDEQNTLIDRLVQSGQYASASEVIRQGLRLLQREEERRLMEKWLREGLTPEEESHLRPAVLQRARKWLHALLQPALDEADRGELIDGEECFARLKQRIEAAVAQEEAMARQSSEQ